MKKSEIENSTVQELCDYAVLKMVEQGGRCVSKGQETDEFADCQYKIGSKRCAVGWVLPDSGKALKLDFEGGIDNFIREHPRSIPRIIKDNLAVFQKLQGFHDSLTEHDRNYYLGKLAQKNINVEKPQWEAWVNLGT